MEIGASHDSFASQQTAAPSQASPSVAMRLPIALHVQQLPPFSAFASQSQQNSGNFKLSGSGYGPPVSSALSPVQAVVRDVVEVRKEYDLVCVALTNARWRVSVFKQEAVLTFWQQLTRQGLTGKMGTAVPA